MSVSFARGVHRLSDHCHAWLQPDGGWGLSNAGLVTASGESLLIDTMMDLAHTTAMLDAMAPVTENAPIRTLVNTHADGDHCHGNQLMPDDVEIIASTDAASRITDQHVTDLRNRLASDGPGADFMRECFADFNFDDIVARPPTRTFDGQLSLTVGDLPVELIALPPAHTTGDVVVFVPQDGVLFAGDVLFVDGAPITWAGPLSSWAQVCDQLIALQPEIVVPGHGPVTDVAGIALMRDYLLRVDEQARQAHGRGLSVVEASRAIDLSGFEHLRQSGRVLQNILSVYREIDPEIPAVSVMAEIQRYEAELA